MSLIKVDRNIPGVHNILITHELATNSHTKRELKPVRNAVPSAKAYLRPLIIQPDIHEAHEWSHIGKL